MNITELDEWQGVTPELVTDWLLSHGWTQKPTQPNWWLKGDDGFLFDAPTFGQVWFWAYALAAIYADGNVQALLREINPRMRKGMPSEAARVAHGGPWVGHMGGEFPLVATGYWNDDGSFNAGLMSWDEHNIKVAALSKHPCAFWPCDANGNKTRWPTDAEGKML